MDWESESQPSTYCTDVEQIMEKDKDQRPIRRSQRLQERSANQCSGRENCYESPRSISEPARTTRRSTRSPPLFPSLPPLFPSSPIEIGDSVLSVNVKPDPSSIFPNGVEPCNKATLEQAKVTTVSENVTIPTNGVRRSKRGKTGTRKPRKRVAAKKKDEAACSRVQRTRRRRIRRPNNTREPSNSVSETDRQQSDKNLETNYINQNFPLMNFSSEVLDARRNRPIERYYVRPSELGPTPGNPSILPAQYPSHFVHQLPPGNRSNLFNDCIIGEVQAEFQRVFHEKELNDYNRRRQETIRPLSEELHNINDDSTDASLSDSMQEIFGTKSLRDVLNLEPIKYRFTEEHLAAVAVILNVELPRLRGVMNLVQKMPPGDITRLAAELAGIGTLAQFDMEVDDKSSDQQIDDSQSPRPEQRRFPSQRPNNNM